jgi:hypothetical protein
MPAKGYKLEQIVTLLPQVEVEIAIGKTTPQACKAADITGRVYYLYKNRSAVQRWLKRSGRRIWSGGTRS